MFNNVLVLAFISALFYGIWPLIMRISKLGPVWVVITLGIGSLAAGLISVKGAIPSVKGIVIGIIAGFACAGGSFAFGKLISTRTVELSQVVPLSVVMMMVIGVIGAVICFGEPLSLKKIAGMATAVVAVYLLS